ncbi:MAG TPA: S66 peptidase family protein [Bacillales bacterium]|nr:S66 peptidase family protein [Bacillales bacterium]
MLKPKKLKPGSRIAVISPSSGMPYVFPGIYELGLKNLRDVLGFEIVEMPTARMSPDELYRHPALRAKDINNSFADDTIDGVIASIGGNESVRILPYLNEELILQNPKLIMGFSDATTFLSYLNSLGMVTFNGPSVMAGLAQMKHLPAEHIQHLKAFLFEDSFPYIYEPFPEWTNGYQDWGNPERLGECQAFYQNDGWAFLQGDSVAEGLLWGGCIQVLEFLKGTDYWPKKSFWHNRILFFETSEDKPTPVQVGEMLRNYGVQGIFQKAAGVIFAKPKDYTNAEKEELHDVVLSVIKEEFGAGELPIVMNVDFGHTDPKLIMPLGGKVRLDPVKNEITLLESPFE